MSSQNPTLALTVPGRLCIGPSNNGMLNGTYPYGGTALGIVSRWKEVREQSYAQYNSEARGRDGVSIFGGRYKMSFTFLLVQYDPDVLQKIWAYSTSSPNAYSGANILTIPKAGQTTLSPGLLATSSPVLFASDDPAHPSTLILAPIWCLGPKTDLDKVLNKPLETSVVIVAGIDANGNDVREDKIQNLSVS